MAVRPSVPSPAAAGEGEGSMNADWRGFEMSKNPPVTALSQALTPTCRCPHPTLSRCGGRGFPRRGRAATEPSRIFAMHHLASALNDKRA